MSEFPSTNLFTRIYNKAAGTTSTKPTAKQLEDRDTKAIEAQSKMPMWKQYAIKAFGNSIDAGMGMLGIGKETKANLAGQLVQAGLPFGAYATKGIKQIFHGTPDSLWTKFNPNVYNKQDVLGHMTHAAEDAAYADRYATKSAWGNSNRKGQRIIPLQPEAKNVLDLVDPNADDISQALAFASPAERREQIKKFKTANRQIGIEPEWVKQDFRHKYNADAPTKEYPLRKVAENLQLSPEVTENMPWDAIRYLDVNEKSWAFPKRTPIRTTYGVPMNDAAEMGVSPIKLVRDDNVTTGNFPIISKASGWGDLEGTPIYKNIYNDQLNNAPEIINKSHEIKTPYIAVNKKGKAIGGAGDKSMLMEEYPDHFVIPNKNYKKGNGDSGSLHIFSQAEYDFMNKQVNTLKPKELIPKKFDIELTPAKDTWKYNLTMGGKDFPQTKMGIALAKKHLDTMIVDGAITPEESLKYIKYLDKIKVK